MGKTSVRGKYARDIMREAIRKRGEKQAAVAETLGMQPPSLSGNMNRRNIGLGVFVKILNALDFDVVVADRKNGDVLWKVKPHED